MKFFFLGCLVTLGVTLAQGETVASAADPLPSWNDTAAKSAIITFVEHVTSPQSPGFVPPEQRIATFDHDGTLWAEQPIYFQFQFAIDRIKALAPDHPEWKTKEPYKSLLMGDQSVFLAAGDKSLVTVMAVAHAGMTVDEFQKTVQDWLATAKHPKTGRLYTEMVYQPMLEVLAYLRANHFKTFLVSGGGVEFMRVFAERVYGIPPEQVIGSQGKLKFEVRDVKPVLIKLPEVQFMDDQAGKVIAIQNIVGRRPIAAFGNSDGDQQMLEWATIGAGERFGLVVHHDDAEREWAYDRASFIGKLDHVWDEGVARGWAIVSMKKDWKRVFPYEP
jgi:phosphoglycolate phosphatase-like HAD superfamily hydrolase